MSFLRLDVFEKNIFLFISFLLHPILIPTYSLYFIISAYSQFFIFNEKSLHILFTLFFLITIFLPVLTLMLMYYSGFLSFESFKSKKERITMPIIMLMFYFFLVLIFRNIELPYFIRLYFWSIFFVNLILIILQKYYYTISMHLYAIGAMIGMIIFYRLEFNVIAQFYWILIVTFSVALTTTARLVLQAHQFKDVFLGFFSGLIFSFLVFQIAEYLLG